MTFAGIQHTNGLSKPMAETHRLHTDHAPSSRWWRDARTMYTGATTLIAAALAFWHFGGSTLFTFQTRVAVLEERSNLSTAVESVRTQLEGQIAGVRLEFNGRLGRIETKVDEASKASAEVGRKMDAVLTKLDNMIAQPAPVAAVEPKKPKAPARSASIQPAPVQPTQAVQEPQSSVLSWLPDSLRYRPAQN